MTSRETRRYDMLVRVRSFGATYRQLFPETSSAHDACAGLAAEISRLEALEVAERSASDGSRAARRDAARAVFQDLLTRAGSTARVLGKTILELQARVPSPLPKDHLQLLTLARHFATGVTAYGAEFAAHGIPLGDLEAGIAAFEAALAHRGSSRDGRVKARAEREAAFDRAMHAVETLDVTVANCLTDPVVLAVWAHDRRVAPPRRRSPEEGATATTEAVAAAAASQRPSTSIPMPTDAIAGEGAAFAA